MKRLLSIVLLVLAGIAINAQSFNINPAHISSNDARGTEKLVFTNNGNSTISFDLRAVETTAGTNQVKTAADVQSVESSESLYDFIETASEGVSWMTISPTSGNVAPGQSVEFTVTFNATDVSQVLSAQILVSTNAEFASRQNISVNLFDNGSRAVCNFFTGTDNENDNLGGTPDGDMDYYWCYGENPAVPIEFNIFVTETTITSAQISIYAYDIDETSGEIDVVYFNGHQLGALTGNNGQWSTTVFALDPSWVNGGAGNAGKNLVQIYITVPGWCVTVDWGQININDCAGDATIRYANLDATCVNPGDRVCVDIEVDSDRQSHPIRVEYNLLNENSIAIDGGSYSYTTLNGNDDPFTRCFNIPGNATPGSVYNVQVIVFDAATNVQTDFEMVPLGIAPCDVPPVPVSNWALFIGIALILTFAVIRFRRMI
jgi:hypothetical protein